jgi:ornithine cyclodeaminase/alanine dehydrogenase-like protein (mu-crystallin family)
MNSGAPGPRCLSDDDVRECLMNVDLQPALEDAVRRVEAGVIYSAPRAALGHGPLGQVTHIMAAKDLVSEQVVTKLVDYDPSRPGRIGRPSLSGIVTYMVAGEVVFVANAAAFTNIRTAAATAMAIDLMAPLAANVVAILGAGPLAKEHALAIARRRHLAEIRIVSLSGRSADRLADELSPLMGLPVKAVASPREACAGASIVVTVTSAVKPILFDGDVGAGTLVAAVGSGTPDRRELDGPLVASATEIVVETLEAAEREAGDLISAHNDGYLDWTKVTPLADILRKPMRAQPSGIALYKSVGAAWQDLACASVIARRLEEAAETKPS